jgi:hypothetical protein
MEVKARGLLALISVMAVVGLGPAPGPAQEEAECRLHPPTGAIDTYVNQLKVGPPRRHANLTLYPIFADGVTVPNVDLTLDEAMARGLLEIRELKSAEVNRALLVSHAKKPIFVMGGEMLTGAKQDRIVGDDLIVPAGAKLTVPVFCVEHGRWVVKSDTFASASFLATSEVRKARAAADQSQVWHQVAAEQERLEAPSATGTLQSVQESKEVQDQMEPYKRALSDLPLDVGKARGVVACVGDEIIAADLFGSRAVFAQLWPKLLDSYVIDAVGRDVRGRAPDAVRIKQWLMGVADAERTFKRTPGVGTLCQLGGRSLMGSALLYEGGVVHMELFAKEGPEVVPFNRLDFRRDRLEEGADTPEPAR